MNPFVWIFVGFLLCCVVLLIGALAAAWAGGRDLRRLEREDAVEGGGR